MSKTVSVSTANHGNQSNSFKLCQQDYLLLKTLQLKAVNLEENQFVPPDVTPRTNSFLILTSQTVLSKIFLIFWLLSLLCLNLKTIGQHLKLLSYASFCVSVIQFLFL